MKKTLTPTSAKQGRQSHPQDVNAASKRQRETGPIDLDDSYSEFGNSDAPSQFVEAQGGHSFAQLGQRHDFDTMQNFGGWPCGFAPAVPLVSTFLQGEGYSGIPTTLFRFLLLYHSSLQLVPTLCSLPT